jgi:signal transduction histidine kinase
LRKGTHPKSRLRDSVAIVEQTLEQVRSLSLNLRPSMLDDLGLTAALRWYVAQQAQRAGLQASFEALIDDSLVSTESRTACFRIVQEALTNIIRHAHAQVVRVRIWQEGESLRALIRDDGVGFDVDRMRAFGGERPHLGLLGMEERASLADGKLEVRSEPDAGCEIALRLPLSVSAR